MGLISDITLFLKEAEIVCYVVYVRITGKVTRLFVTDFTKNRLLNTQNSFECKFDDKVISGDLLLQITLFKEQYDSLIRSFYSTTRQHLIDPDTYNEQFVKEKLCLLRVELKVKNYRNTIDAVAQKVSVLHQDTSESSFYNRIFDELPESYVRENWQMFKNRIDDQYLPNCDIPATLAGEWPRNEEEEEDEEGEPSIKLEPTPRTLKELDDEIIPDTLYPEDYADAQWSQRTEPFSDNQDTGFYSMEPELEKSHGSSQVNVAERSAPSQFKENVYKRKEPSRDSTMGSSIRGSTKKRSLTSQHTQNSSSEYGTQNRNIEYVYSVQGRLVGTIPELSRVCSKSYFNEFGETKIGDPAFRDLTLVFSEEGSRKLVEVVLTGTQVEAFFGGALVEVVYTKIEQYQHQMSNYIKLGKSIQIDIQKSENPAGPSLPEVWTLVNTKFTDFIADK